MSLEQRPSSGCRSSSTHCVAAIWLHCTSWYLDEKDPGWHFLNRPLLKAADVKVLFHNWPPSLQCAHACVCKGHSGGIKPPWLMSMKSYFQCDFFWEVSQPAAGGEGIPTLCFYLSVTVSFAFCPLFWPQFKFLSFCLYCQLIPLMISPLGLFVFLFSLSTFTHMQPPLYGNAWIPFCLDVCGLLTLPRTHSSYMKLKEELTTLNNYTWACPSRLLKCFYIPVLASTSPWLV